MAQEKKNLTAPVKAKKPKQAPQQEVRRGRPGRPSVLGEPVRPRQIYITDSCAEFLRRMGAGNVSAGIRAAAAAAGWKPRT